MINFSYQYRMEIFEVVLRGLGFGKGRGRGGTLVQPTLTVKPVCIKGIFMNSIKNQTDIFK